MDYIQLVVAADKVKVYTQGNPAEGRRWLCGDPRGMCWATRTFGYNICFLIARPSHLWVSMFQLLVHAFKFVIRGMSLLAQTILELPNQLTRKVC